MLQEVDGVPFSDEDILWVEILAPAGQPRRRMDTQRSWPNSAARRETAVSSIGIHGFNIRVLYQCENCTEL